MEYKRWKVDDFIGGTNTLPAGYHWNVSTAGRPIVQVSLDSRWGTRVEEPRNPSAPILNIPTDWDELIRLAVQIAHMAQAASIRLPDGVLVKVTH